VQQVAGALGVRAKVARALATSGIFLRLPLVRDSSVVVNHPWPGDVITSQQRLYLEVLWCALYLSALYLSYICLICAPYMSFICPIYFIYLPHMCLVFAPCMSLICPIYVIHLPHTSYLFAPYVLHATHASGVCPHMSCVCPYMSGATHSIVREHILS
jgi:hypothetical protein